MSWESTVTYYQEINRRVRQVQGGLDSAGCIVYPIDFAEIEEYQRQRRWDEAGAVLGDAAVSLTREGAQAIVLATNTMHLVMGKIERTMEGSAAGAVPVIHIVDATGEKIVERGYKTVGLLGTRLKEKYELDVVVPGEEDRKLVNDVIFSELCNGIIRDESRVSIQRIIDELAKA